MKFRFVSMILWMMLSFSQGLTPHIPIDIAKTIVKSTTELLHNENIPMNYKKPIILFLIEVAQKGDSSGSQILTIYHNIVDKVL